MKTIEQLGISPAPWHIKDGTDVPCMKCEHGEIPLVDAYGSFENVNDVYIIAAAPELYEALRVCVEELNKIRERLPDGEYFDPTMATNMACAALEKAGGAQ